MSNRVSKLTSLWICSALAAAGAAKPVILSTDVGNEIDDQWAITYLLTNPAFDVRGIMSANGPSLPDPSAHATYKVLVDVVEHRLGMLNHPPLFEGSSVALPDNRTAHDNRGVQFVIETSKQFSQEHRLTILTIGAATDVASAILEDPSITDRIEVVAMGFKSLKEGGREFNIENDPKAWQVILNSSVPVVIGSADVCKRDLAMSFTHARELLGQLGGIGAWLWQDYQDWYFRNVKPLRVNDFSKPWIIWDIVTLAYEKGWTQQSQIARPKLEDDLSFTQGSGRGTIQWITAIDSEHLWKSFAFEVTAYQEAHATSLSPCFFKQ